MNRNLEIAIFGDSILRGVLLDPEAKKYYFMSDDIFKEFERRFSLKLLNKSSFGCVIEKGYRKIRSMLSGNHQCSVAVLEYGGNDCDFNWAEVAKNPELPHTPKTPLETFKETYRRIITDLRAKGITPVCMSLPPIDAEKYLSWITRDGISRERLLSWLGDTQTISRHQELYSLATTEVALKTGTALIDIRSAFLERRDYRSLICHDGIHPNEDGHRLISKVCEEFASKNLHLLNA